MRPRNDHISTCWACKLPSYKYPFPCWLRELWQCKWISRPPPSCGRRFTTSYILHLIQTFLHVYESINAKQSLVRNSTIHIRADRSVTHVFRKSRLTGEKKRVDGRLSTLNVSIDIVDMSETVTSPGGRLVAIRAFDSWIISLLRSHTMRESR
ncbi:hypothetical protein GGS21DRAFT_188880 [Xylaria nigripes]|nr:hypothetical protein GGS21DRAFT_188880 [Xylaria nigripes]